MSIVCGTDFSLDSAEAANTAAVFAKLGGQPLRLIHASVALIGDFETDPVQTPMWRQLKEEAERLRDQKIEVREQLVVGTPEEVLTEEARISGRLIVVGAHGQTAGPKWSFGASAARTAQLAQSPVLMVQSSEPFLSWGQGQPLKVLLGYDHSVPSQAAFRWVQELRRFGPCEVTVLNLYYPPAEYNRLGISHPTYLEGHPEIEKVLVRELREALGNPGDDVRLVAHPCLGEAAQELRQYAAKENFAVLVLGTHQRRGLRKLWFGSTSETLLTSAPTAVLCVPAPAQEAVRGHLPKLRRVLVPTDFSEIANHAVPYAFSLSGSGGEVTLLHVVEGPADKAISNRDSLVSRLRALVPHEAKELGIDTKIEVVASIDPTEAICQAAERLGADAVCICTRGRSGLGALLFGSITRGVMEQSRRPVLVVYPPKPT